MTRFFTADLHLGHRNIVHYSGRPFREVDERNVALIERWNETVGSDELIACGPDEERAELAELYGYRIVDANAAGEVALVPSGREER